MAGFCEYAEEIFGFIKGGMILFVVQVIFRKRSDINVQVLKQIVLHPLSSALRTSVILRHVMRQADGTVDRDTQEFRRCKSSATEPPPPFFVRGLEF